MPGLSLNVGGQGSAQGSYTPMMPASASAPTAANSAQAAFGIGTLSAGGSASGSAYAGMGSVSVGAIALVLMGFIWYSLPR